MNKKHLLILFFLLIIFSCSKSKKKILLEKNAKDSATYYYKFSNKEGIRDKEKIRNLKKAFLFISKNKNTLENRNLLNKFIIDFTTLQSPEGVNRSSNLLLIRSVIAKDSINLGMAYRGKANYFYKKQILDSSFYYYIKAEKVYYRLKDKTNYPNILLNKGIIQYNIGDYLGSELSLNKAYSLFKNLDDYNKIYGCLAQLGLVSTELKDYDKAIFFNFKALEAVDKLASEEDKNYYRALCNNNIGYLYIKSNDFDKAKYYFLKALKLKSIEHEDPLLYSNLIDNLGYSKLKTDDFRDLPDLFFTSLLVRKKIKNNAAIGTSNIHLSEYYFYKKDYEKAVLYSQNAIQTAKNAKNSLDIISALKQASIVDKENASKYSDDYIRISDSLQLAERKNKDRFARIELETDEIRQQRDNFEEESQNNLYYLLGTVSFFIVLITIRTQRTKARVRAMKQAQQIANEEIYKLIISQQGKLQEGRELEKSRIAKDLHDGVLGRLFGLRLNLDGLNNRTEAEAVAMRLNYINELKLIEQDIREISHELSREKEALINNFVSILNNLIDDQSKVNKAVIKIKIGRNIDWDKFSNLVKINLYRILQESLQNINKYADANNIKIDIINDNKNLVLKIVDDGKGFNVDKKSYGIGIKNMISRTNECKGTLDVKSEINNGTKITLTIPFENKTLLN